MLTAIGTQDIFFAKYNSNGGLVWVKQAGGSSAFNEALAILADNNGNSYLTGDFRKTTDFGGTSFTATGANDPFIAKYDINGTLIWAKQGTTSVPSSNNIGIDFAFDGSGNILMGGNFSNNITFGATTLSTTSQSENFVVKYDINGNLLAANNYGTGSTFSKIAYNNSSYMIIGYYYENTSFQANQLPLQGYVDMYFTKFDNNNQVVFAKNAYTVVNQNTSGTDVAVDGQGNSYMLANFSGNLEINNTVITSAGFASIFLVKYNSLGNIIWLKKIDQTIVDQSKTCNGKSLKIDGQDNLYLYGSFSGIVDFGGSNLTATNTEDFIVKYGADGTLNWVKQTSNTTSTALRLDNSNNIYISGGFSGTANFDGNTITGPFGSIFLAKYNSNGVFSMGKANSIYGK